MSLSHLSFYSVSSNLSSPIMCGHAPLPLIGRSTFYSVSQKSLTAPLTLFVLFVMYENLHITIKELCIKN